MGGDALWGTSGSAWHTSLPEREIRREHTNTPSLLGDLRARESAVKQGMQDVALAFEPGEASELKGRPRERSSIG
jgi:hypothetical protein